MQPDKVGFPGNPEHHARGHSLWHEGLVWGPVLVLGAEVRVIAQRLGAPKRVAGQLPAGGSGGTPDACCVAACFPKPGPNSPNLFSTQPRQSKSDIKLLY